MKQKLFLFAMAFLTITFFSCEKNAIENGPEISTSDSVIPVEEYCQGILDWLDDTYAPGQVSIDSVLLITGGNNGAQDVFEVHLSNGAVALFSSAGCQFISIDCNCSTDYAPVCWNDITYDNQCFAECDGAVPADIVDGECGCDCSNEPIDPVCWMNAMYDNECEAICAGANPEEIEADCDECDCSDEAFNPVCWNGTTYNNQCEAICVGANPAEIIDGPCDNSTCEAEVEELFPGVIITINSESDNGAGIYTYNVTVGNSANHTLDVQFTYNCAFYSPCNCDFSVNFVCANGTNYLNECAALCAGADIADITAGWCP